MSTFWRFSILFVFLCLVNLASYQISFQFKHNAFFAIIFLPQACLFFSYLYLHQKYWLVILLSELTFIFLLRDNFNFANFLILLTQSIARLYFFTLLKEYVQTKRLQWETHFFDFLLMLLQTIVSITIYSLASLPFGLEKSWVITSSLYTITGLVIILPIGKLLNEWFRPTDHQTKQFITERLNSRFLLWALVFYLTFVVVELYISNLVPSLTSIFILAPTIFFAYHFLWQGACIAVIINSFILSIMGYFLHVIRTEDELLVLITSQALIGFIVGIMTSRQHLLTQQSELINTQLKQQLDIKNKLAVKLVTLEEDIKKNIARELHDEVGQNITAIQIHAHLIGKQADNKNTEQISSQIHELAKNIHLFIRSLLFKLRPVLLDEVGLENAINQLIQELKFSERGVHVTKIIQVDNDRIDEVTKVTIYRIVQELLNNIVKHAQAKRVVVSLVTHDLITLKVIDDGIGFAHNWREKGQGLKGIQERVKALGGAIRYLSSDNAAKNNQIIVTLLTKDSKSFLK